MQPAVPESPFRARFMSSIPMISEDPQLPPDDTGDMLRHVEESLWFPQPAADINHPAWQVSQMAMVQYGWCWKRSS